MSFVRHIVAFGYALVLPLIASAVEPVKEKSLDLEVKTSDVVTLKEVPNFALLDYKGRYYELRRHSDARAIVLFFTGNGCPIARASISKLDQLRSKWGSKKVLFCMINSNPQDDVKSIAEEALTFNIRLPILKDEAQAVAKSLNVNRTAEVIAINTKDWTIFYCGAIDDQLSEGAKRPQPSEHYLENALTQFLNGKPVELAATKVSGCRIHLEDANTGGGEITYTQHVAPILANKCFTCHRAGNIGPFAMSSYRKIKGWSEMIKEVILTKRMPPWHADPHYGRFAEDRSLTPEETRTMISWIDSGMPEGPGDDPLAKLTAAAPEQEAWSLGKPDYVVPISEPIQIPASGVIDYITNIVASPIPHDTWLRAAIVRPGNRSVVHHIIVYLEYPEGHPGRGRFENIWLTSWVPGTKDEPFPSGTGKFLPKGTKLRFQLHYNTTGKAEVDQSEVGLYLMSEKPERAIEIRAVQNHEFRIPPHAQNYETMAMHEFPAETVVYDLSPHMHKRGSWFRYEALYPDGSHEILLSVPKYDFNWQTTYRFAEPKVFPAGTRVLCTGGFDNSKLNPHNPDPTASVRWGEQSFEEMFIGFMTISDAKKSVLDVEKR